MRIYDDGLFKPAPFRNRENFGRFLNEQGLRGAAVEIGVHRGYFAKQLLQQWQGESYFGVDVWEDIPEYHDQLHLLPDYETGKSGSYERDHDLQHTIDLLRKDSRVVLIRGESIRTSKVFGAGSLDFLYLDGNHFRQFAEADLRAWWHTIRPGGIFAGHDLCYPGHTNFPWEKEILPMVRDWAREHNLTAYAVEEDIWPWSWYFIKPSE